MGPGSSPTAANSPKTGARLQPVPGPGVCTYPMGQSLWGLRARASQHRLEKRIQPHAAAHPEQGPNTCHSRSGHGPFLLPGLQLLWAQGLLGARKNRAACPMGLYPAPYCGAAQGLGLDDGSTVYPPRLRGGRGSHSSPIPGLHPSLRGWGPHPSLRGWGPHPRAGTSSGLARAGVARGIPWYPSNTFHSPGPSARVLSRGRVEAGARDGLQRGSSRDRGQRQVNEERGRQRPSANSRHRQKKKGPPNPVRVPVPGAARSIGAVSFPMPVLPSGPCLALKCNLQPLGPTDF